MRSQRFAGAKQRPPRNTLECATYAPSSVTWRSSATIRRATELLRRVRPNVVITASPADYHCDHEATSVMVRDACFGASAPNYKTGQDPEADALAAIPHLYFADSVGGVSRFGDVIEPDF